MKTYKDIYKFPLEMYDKDYYTRVSDAKGNFVFQFTFYKNYKGAKSLLDTINNDKNLTDKTGVFSHKEGIITFNRDGVDTDAIMIRGWGNLTGTGAHNLKEDEAANIQDTFAEFIVERLNFRE